MSFTESLSVAGRDYARAQFGEPALQVGVRIQPLFRRNKIVERPDNPHGGLTGVCQVFELHANILKRFARSGQSQYSNHLFT
jgi:hypothetical protein